MSRDRVRFVATMALLSLGACSSGSGTGRETGAAGAGSSAAGTTGGAGTGNAGAAGDGSTGAAGDSTTGAAGTGSSGAAGAGTGTGGTTGAAGTTGAGGTTGAAGTTSTGGTTGVGGTMGAAGTTAGADPCNPPPPRPINVTGTGTFSMNLSNGQYLYLNKDKKPIQGKLFLLLPGIGNGPGSGGFESFIKLYGFHVFAPKTDSNLVGGSVPQSYPRNDPTNTEANRQVGDARTDLWDGKNRVSWYTVAAQNVILNNTIAAINMAMQADPGGDWGFFLNADGTLRTTDVWVVGYSWGAQTWSFMSTYVRFGKVIAASGPVNEGFPYGSWMTDSSATPEACKYALVSDGQATDMFPNVMKAMWPGAVTMVTPTSPGPYTADQHLFEMVGGNGGVTPGGHTVFCNDNPMNGWWPVCKHVLGVPP